MAVCVYTYIYICGVPLLSSLITVLTLTTVNLFIVDSQWRMASQSTQPAKDM